ncbi:hypothetical protein CRUP_033493 [Coryphaenoides rupestris]|nr:hypothetical protein CRUP_033493 [Coryphaenoides rupestris]
MEGMFSKLTSLFQQALETAVEETGPCLEYLLQHKVLETLCTLGKAQKLIGLCAAPGSEAEKEEAQLLLAVCSQVKRDPYLLNYVLKRGRVRQKAHEGLLLLVGLQAEDSGETLTRRTRLVLAHRLSGCVHQLWLTEALLPQLMSTGESAVLLSTVVLCRAVQAVRSAALLDRLVLFLLGSQSQPEDPLATHDDGQALRERLIQQCDHISEEISMASLRLFEELLRKPHGDILPNLVLRNLKPRLYLSLAPAALDDRHTDSGEDHDFLCLVPQEVKSSQLVQEGGYDSYVLDAQSLCEECSSHAPQDWPEDWPEDLPPPSSSSVAEGSVFYEGHFLQVLFDRLGRLLEQPYDLNLQLTSVVSRLAAFKHPVLTEFLLDPYITLTPGARTLFTVLIRVIGELMQRVQVVPDVSDRLIRVRQKLLDLDQHSREEHQTLLQGIILLEEFCKELAAIAFVKLTLDPDGP